LLDVSTNDIGNMNHEKLIFELRTNRSWGTVRQIAEKISLDRRSTWLNKTVYIR